MRVNMFLFQVASFGLIVASSADASAADEPARTFNCTCIRSICGGPGLVDGKQGELRVKIIEQTVQQSFIGSDSTSAGSGWQCVDGEGTSYRPEPGAPAPTAPAPTAPPPTAPALAAAPASDGERVVSLRDGSIYRGEIVEYVPNDHLTLKLATGEVKRFEASQIVSDRPPTRAPASPASAVKAPPPGPARTAPTRAPVHIESPSPGATLYRDSGGGSFHGFGAAGTYVGTVRFWNPVCPAPCDQPIDRFGTFSIRGTEMAQSGDFSLPYSGAVTINVRPWPLNNRRIGFGLTVLGALMLAGGGALIGRAALSGALASAKTPQEMREAADSQRAYNTGGGVMVGFGVPIFIVGLVMSVKKTGVDIE